MEDGEIMDLYLKGDEEAVRRTDAKYHSLMFSVALNVLGDRRDAEECVNDALLAAWEAVPKAIPKSLPAFLTKLVRADAVDRRRRASALKRGGGELPLIFEELSECISAPSDGADAEGVALRELLNEFVNALPDGERRLFIGRYFWSLPVSELARLHGKSRGAVKMALVRIRKKLREHLEKEDIRV